MLEMQQSVKVRDAVITAFWDVICRNASLEAEISEVLAVTALPEPVLDEGVQSKKELVSAYLKDRHIAWMRWFENEIKAKYEATDGGLEIIADVLREGFEDPKRFGLAFISIATGGGSFDNESCAIVGEQKEHLNRVIEQLAVTMGLKNPRMAASAAVLIIDRTIVRTLITGSPNEAHAARLLFQCLQHA